MKMEKNFWRPKEAKAKKLQRKIQNNMKSLLYALIID